MPVNDIAFFDEIAENKGHTWKNTRKLNLKNRKHAVFIDDQKIPV